LRFFLLMTTSLMMFAGCSSETSETNWEPSPTFEAGNLVLYGVEGKFSITRLAPEGKGFGTGGHYRTLFWGDKDELIKKKYKMIAINKEEETKKLYEWGIDLMPENDETGATAQSGAKFGLDPGIWKIEITVDGEPFTSFVVEAK
jgi:hypothetical protein